MSDDKTALRAKMRGILRKHEESTARSACLADHLRNWAAWQSSATIAAFSALAGEPDLLDPWPGSKRVALPRVVGEALEFRWITGREALVPGAFGIREPSPDAPSAGAAFDLILVPGLGFDRRGHRLGRGKGFYDRFLAVASGVRVGVCFGEQIVDEVPREAHDLAMDFLLTPDGILRCGL